VVTVGPLHSLAAAVMAGRGVPALLLAGGSSPHAYALKPSDARKLARADVIVRLGPSLEGFLERPLANLAAGARIVTLVERAELIRLRAREGGVWEKRDEEEHGHRATVDPHLWLDPENAGRIAKIVAAALGEVDPEGAATYARNADDLGDRIEALERELRATLAPVRRAPYVVFHDAYQYFERRYGLNAIGSVAVDPERAPGARRLTEIRARIRDGGAACVFSEPQFRPRVLTTIVEGSGARLALLDPLGADLAPGPEAYFELMRRLARSLAACLAPSGG
jgi:zinc transport system substrate-binding protein